MVQSIVTIIGWFVAFCIAIRLNEKSHAKNLELQERIFKHEIKNKTYLDIQKAIKNNCDELLDFKDYVQEFSQYLKSALESEKIAPDVSHFKKLALKQGSTLHPFKETIDRRYNILNEKNITFINIYESNQIVFPEFTDRKYQIEKACELLDLSVTTLISEIPKGVETPVGLSTDFCHIITTIPNQVINVHKSLKNLKIELQNNFLGQIFKETDSEIKETGKRFCPKTRAWVRNMP